MKFRRVIYYLLMLLCFFNFKQNYIIAENKIVEEELNNELIQDDFYILGQGDLLKLNILGAPELSSEVSIINDGTISMPLLGNIKISGLTIEAAKIRIEKLLSNQLLQNDVQLLIVKTRPIKVAVIGEVARPGIYSLTDREVSEIETTSKVRISGLPTVIDAIQKSGGLTKKADLQKIKLTRKMSGDTNQYKKTNLNLLNLIKRGDLSQNPFLFDSDIIEIKQIKNGNVSQNGLLITKSNLSPSSININVVGEVVNPGEYKVKNNTSLIRGILAAGGPKDIGSNKGKVKLLRINGDGKHKVFSYKYDLTKKTSDKDNPMLLSGDTLIVNSSLFGKTSKRINSISQPVSGIVQVWTLLKLIND